MAPPPPIGVNRAPVLTLWATVVAEQLAYPSETALTLGRFVAGSSARAKARRLGISDEKQEAEERHTKAAELKPRRQTIHLLGREIPVRAADDGTLRAEDDGKPASDKSVQSYIARAFGDRLGEARGAMEALAASMPPEELNRVGFRLYERFRPDVPEDHAARQVGEDWRQDRASWSFNYIPDGRGDDLTRTVPAATRRHRRLPPLPIGRC
jgi:hypothetical protein